VTIILNDEDLAGNSFMAIAIDAVEKALLARFNGKAVSPPRHHVSFPGHGDLVFTVGGFLGEVSLAGFRVYETFHGPKHSQIVAVWSTDDARFKGLIVGERLGAIRTGAIGGVAIRHLSSPHANVVGVVGSGLQARTQLAAAAAVRRITHARVYSRSEANRIDFARQMQLELGIEVTPVETVPEAVADADIVLCATSSHRPVVSASDLKPGAHVNTVGPKTLEGHELDVDIAATATVIATDSPEQTRAYSSPFFLDGSGHERRMADLSDVLAGKAMGRKFPEETTLFCSVGLAGTEVIVASAIFDGMSGMKGPRDH
jgi:alanine dehydrogenase